MAAKVQHIPQISIAPPYSETIRELSFCGNWQWRQGDSPEDTEMHTKGYSPARRGRTPCSGGGGAPTGAPPPAAPRSSRACCPRSGATPSRRGSPTASRRSPYAPTWSARRTGSWAALHKAQRTALRRPLRRPRGQATRTPCYSPEVTRQQDMHAKLGNQVIVPDLLGRRYQTA